MDKSYKLILGDCLEKMKEIEDKSIDMILCDLPYGTTVCKWDTVIPFDKLWEQYNRVVKDNGAIVLFGTEPFSSFLRVSNIKNYRYDIIWEKERITNFFFVKKQIAKCHENISVFYRKQPTYNIQYQQREGKKSWNRSGKMSVHNLYNQVVKDKASESNGDLRYPRSVQKFSIHNVGLLHPTQKPLGLLEFLVKTFTNKNELVLDNCMGSGSTGVACLNTSRRFIGIEKDENYFNIAKERIENHVINR